RGAVRAAVVWSAAWRLPHVAEQHESLTPRADIHCQSRRASVPGKGCGAGPETRSAQQGPRLHPVSAEIVVENGLLCQGELGFSAHGNLIPADLIEPLPQAATACGIHHPDMGDEP